jgi:alpha-tubulin suppressor-like RCC1 family protein
MIENGVYSFGWNKYGQLGLGFTYDEKWHGTCDEVIHQCTPRLISSLKNEKIKNVFCGWNYTIPTGGRCIFD